jgi:spermidine synthase
MDTHLKIAVVCCCCLLLLWICILWSWRSQEYIHQGPFVDQGDEGLNVTFNDTRRLFYQRTKGQTIEVYNSPYLGKLLVIDGDIQFCEVDEANYHEMMVHVPLAYNHTRHDMSVLIIGGGDGGALREVCRYARVGRVVLVDVSKDVINVCQTFFPQLAAGAFHDPRVRLVIRDAADFLASGDAGVATFDVVLVDLTDQGLSDSVFTETASQGLKRCLRPDGVVVRNFCATGLNRTRRHTEELRTLDALGERFAHSCLYQYFQPTFVGGQYAFAFMSDTVLPLRDLPAAGAWPYDTELHNGKHLCYYTPSVHIAGFALPRYMVTP